MGDLWWLQVSNAKRLIKGVVEVLVDGKSVIACLPSRLPYPDTFEKIIKEKLRYNFPKMELAQINLLYENISNVGEYMLNKYCKEKKRIQYRGDKSIAAFLAESTDIVFHDRYFWVKNIPTESIAEWVDFINEYNKKLAYGLSPAFFFLETNSEEALKLAKGAIVGISFDATISDYDRYAFCTAIAAENSCKLSVRDYLAQLVASVAGEDIELCAECVAKSKEFLSNPIRAIEDIITTKTRSNGANFEYSLDKESLEEKIWIAQVRTVFPVVERARIKYIKTYFDQLNQIISSRNIVVATDVAESPYDLELGTLIYLAGARMLILQQSEYEKLDMFRNARNDMAHQTTMDYSKIDRLLSTKF